MYASGNSVDLNDKKTGDMWNYAPDKLIVVGISKWTYFPNPSTITPVTSTFLSISFSLVTPNFGNYYILIFRHLKKFTILANFLYKFSAWLLIIGL